MRSGACPDIGENAPPVCLFTENPNRLVSLLDMLRVHALNFVRVGALLERCSANPHVITEPDVIISQKMSAEFFDVTQTIEADCHELGLVHTEEIVDFHMRKFANGMTYEELSRSANEISRIYHSEVRNKAFYHVLHGRAEYFNRRELFGPEVEESFPSSSLEIRDAASCYALEQDTACVMHLMRALETPLILLANRFDVNTERKQWHNIISDTQGKVNNMGPSYGADWKEQETLFSSACSQFMHFKNAWRNHAMHGRVRYNPTDSSDVMEHVKRFMQILAPVLHEDVKE